MDVKRPRAFLDLGIKVDCCCLMGIDYENVPRLAASIGIIPKTKKETFILLPTLKAEAATTSVGVAATAADFSSSR